MADVLKLTPREFARGYKAYQAREPRDAMYRIATFLVKHHWGRPRDMADGLGVLLLTWNNAFYRYGSFDFNRLEVAIRRNMAAINGFRKRNITSLSKVGEPAIKQLFNEFLEALRVKKKDEEGFKRSPVAVAKALHLLAPSFFPIWDIRIAIAYGCRYYDQPAIKYLKFAYYMQALAQNLSQRAPASSGRSFLKLIDEYNYSKYTQGWV
ncbi:hypothetical protein RAS2_29120 [Phycisphaerae bacterium RAS2]|nr:hypothetical protein RAS2_29120 [Phycisphaerae bacterium RAS2]